MDWLNVITRWLHVVAAVAGVGGIFFMLLVVLPVLRDQPEAAAGVGGAIARRYKRIAHAAVGLLLVTGLYNYLAVAVPKVRGMEVAKTYHAVMGVKILLALALFVFAILLLKPLPAMAARRQQWLTTNALLGLAILALGAYLRRLWP